MESALRERLLQQELNGRLFLANPWTNLTHLESWVYIFHIYFELVPVITVHHVSEYVKHLMKYKDARSRKDDRFLCYECGF
jgi:hypothetical protein